MPVFVDTNVLIYARDASEGVKQERALEWLTHLWRTHRGRISFQILEEFYVTVTRKLTPGMADEEARVDIRDFLAWGPVGIDGPALEDAWAIQDRYALSFWDALVVAAARIARCDEILTVDLQDGQELAGVRVVDPFSHAP